MTHKRLIILVVVVVLALTLACGGGDCYADCVKLPGASIEACREYCGW